MQLAAIGSGSDGVDVGRFLKFFPAEPKQRLCF